MTDDLSFSQMDVQSEVKAKSNNYLENTGKDQLKLTYGEIDLEVS